MKIKKSNFKLTVGILLLITLVASAGYAYFVSTIELDDQLTFEAMFNSVMPGFIAHVDRNIDLQVYTTDMLSQSVGAAKSDYGTIVVEFLSGSETTNATCWYDIDYVWDSPVYTPTHSLPIVDEENSVVYNFELALKGSRVTTGDEGFVYDDKNFAETNIDALPWIAGETNKAKLVTQAEIHNQSSTVPSVTTWTFTLSFYSLPTTQNSLLNQSFQGHLEISNARC